MNVLRVPHVVDISHHNAPVDFHTLKAAGAVAIIAKATQGSNMVDNRFAEFQKRVATVPGLLFMSYHFLDNSDVDAQIRHYITVTQGVHGRWLDYEHNPGQVSLAQTIAGWQELQQKQQSNPGTYGSDLLARALQDPNCVFKQGPLWAARYESSTPPALPHGVVPDLWQYTEHGQIAGATDDIDLSVYMKGDAAACSAWISGLLK